MRVLWFTNNPSSAAGKIGMNLISGDWLISLEDELTNDSGIDLAICFYSYKSLEPFQHNRTQFYPVLRQLKKSKFRRFINRLSLIRDTDELEIKGLIKVIELFKPDLIHVHGTEDNFGLVQEYTNVPTVVTIQGILSSITEKFFTGIPFDIVSCHESTLDKFAAAGIRQYFKQLKAYAKRERKILSNSNYIIGRTDMDRSITRVLAPSSVYFVGNEILRSSFYHNIWNKTQFSDPIQIVTTTGDALYKGFDTIVSTAQILKETTDLHFTWKVIGLNEMSSSVKIVSKWKGVNLSNYGIHLLGYQNEQEILKTLLSSDFYCQTSHIDNSSNSLCEAMILGMPVIATFAGGTSSLLKDKEEGILIQDGDPYSIAGEILCLSRDFQTAQSYGNAARGRALQRHNKTFVKEAYLKIYNSIIEEDTSKFNNKSI